ncbi:retron St85 family effector protein [Pectobacterium versatile]|uniref:retron St85 family effector protein n=1 Tax=Pectobacterium versatile TaxID=2488639 RepID=UPI001CF34F31|nr:retron St85 family effector protein [Pectobacterium versatile]MCA6926047.1 retron St85 family effector protein [Pectobacterium versatile]
MLMQLKRSKTELNRAITAFYYFLENGKVKCPGNVKEFVFLCGANRENGSPSARREELLNFSYRNLPNCHFFLAELVFKELTTNSNNSLSDNLLDVETELSNLADSIVIVLESYSSFTELGAFSYSKELRKKLIVINDTKYINANSFINHGPVKAIKDVTKKNYYIIICLKGNLQLSELME